MLNREQAKQRRVLAQQSVDRATKKERWVTVACYREKGTNYVTVDSCNWPPDQYANAQDLIDDLFNEQVKKAALEALHNG